MEMRRVFWIVLGLLMFASPSADAARWNQQYIRRLPDSAFAAVETTPDGKSLRHLPHHDAHGTLDVPHLCNALVRIGQVKWHDRANAEAAGRHLAEHLAEVGRKACRPARKGSP